MTWEWRQESIDLATAELGESRPCLLLRRSMASVPHDLGDVVGLIVGEVPLTPKLLRGRGDSSEA